MMHSTNNSLKLPDVPLNPTQTGTMRIPPWNGLKRRLIGSSKSAATVSSRRGIGFRRKYGHWPVEKMGFCGRCSTGEKPLEECDIRRGVGGSK